MLPARRALLRAALRSRAFCTTPAPPGAGPNHRALTALDENTIRPFAQPNAFISPTAHVIGSVTVNDKAALRAGAVVRGDLALIAVGAHVVLGEGAVISAGVVRDGVSPADAVATGLPMKAETNIGNYCSIGAGAVIRGAHLEGENFVGDGAVLGEGVRLGEGAQVAHRAFVPDGTQIPAAEEWAGNPAQKVRDIPAAEVQKFVLDVEASYGTTVKHMYEFLPVGTAYLEKEALAKAEKAASAQ